MKKMRKWAAVLAVCAASLFALGCSSDDSDSDSGGGSGSGSQVTIKCYNADEKESWILYAWAKESQKKYTGDWPGNVNLTEKDSDGCLTGKISIDKSETLGVIFNNGNGTQTADAFISTDLLAEHDVFYFIYDDTTPYLSFSEMAGLNKARISSADGNTLAVTHLGKDSVSASDFEVTAKDGTALKVDSVSGTAPALTLTLLDGGIAKSPYKVTLNGTSVYALPDSSYIDGAFADTDGNFGISYDSLSAVTFTTWAPLATNVKLLLFSDSSKVSGSAEETIDMESADKGVWKKESVDCTNYKYYKYAFTICNKTYEVADIWSFAASADSVASQIVDINSDSRAIATGTHDTAWGAQASYYTPFSGSYSDAVIYEMHIRDWSKAYGATNSGKFEEITAALKDADGFAAHLKDLGVTHVQILPMFDYALTNDDADYNWGYNPYHYNVPEGRYVKNMTDGTDAVKQLRAMISAFHDAGIAVNMDVVYNHTSGTGTNSLYDMTVPEYFYRLNENGGYYNGSGCGNEIATNHEMVKKYVIESLKHWMLDYHINGFRFDLMGCLEASTMKEIYDELYKIDEHVMVYGEPWTGGTSGVTNGATSAGEGTTGAGYGAFDDDFRDAIKGAEFGGFKKGQVQGTFNDTAIINGLMGNSSNERNKTDKPELALHYVECHDNYTLIDKIIIAFGNGTDSKKWKNLAAAYFTDEERTEMKNQDTLAAAYVILSQGTVFLNGGQEFLRTKQGDENSYISSDSINAIDLSFKTTYSDVYNTYKGLIALRKANPTAFGANTSAKAEVYNNTKGVTKYETGDFCVYFNATSIAENIATTGYTKLIDVTSGALAEITTLPTSAEAKSFVILKK